MADRTLAIFGISGQTGRALAAAAAERGWSVRGLVRPGSETAGLGGTALIQGGLSDTARVAETVAGADAVCCVFGPRPPYTDVFCADATTNILAAMHDAKVERIVCQTGAMIGAGDRTFFFGRMSAAFARRQPASSRDRVEQERRVMGSGRAWTLVKPPRLTDTPGRRPVQTGTGLRMGLMSRIGRENLAHFLLDLLDQEDAVGARLFVRE